MNNLDRTRLIRLFYEASVPKFVYKRGESWVAITSKAEGDGHIVGLAAPLINVHHETHVALAKSYVQEATRKHYFGDREVTIAKQERPKKSTGWTKPLLCDKVVNTNAPVEFKKGRDWLTLSPQNLKRNRKGDAYGGEVPDPYLIWDEAEYSSYETKKAITQGKRVVNRLMEELEIVVDASPVGVPYADLTSSSAELYVFESHKDLFLSLLELIKNTGTEDHAIWIDVVRVCASLRSREMLADLDVTLTDHLGKTKRNEIGLTPEALLEKYESTEKQLFKGRIYVGFETLMDHLERIDEVAYLLWRSNWINEAMNAIYNKQKPQLPGLAIVAARKMRGTIFHDPSQSHFGTWYSYSEGLKRWIKERPDAERFLTLIGDINKKVEAIVRDPSHSQDLTTHLKACVDILQGETGREKLLKEMKEIVKIRSFSSIADKNYDMIPFMNVCVEVVRLGDKRKVFIRPHKKQDFVTKVIAIRYNASMSWNHPKVLKVMDFFSKFIPDDESREFLLYWCGSILWRGNRDRCILNIEGGGGNAKTVFCEILFILGELIAKIKASAFYAYEKHAGSADTEFMAMKGAAVAMVEEIEPGKTGRVTVAKNLSGGGRIPLRAIFQAEELVDSTAKLLFVGNNLLHWPDDQAMRDRNHVMVCESRFSDSAPSDPERQKKEKHFPKDSDFIGKIPDMEDALIWVFVEYLKKYVELGRLPEAAKIKRDTEAYWKAHDIYKKFLEDTYVRDPACYVLQNDLFLAADHYFSKSPWSKEWKRDKLLHHIQSEMGICANANDTGYDTAKCIVRGLGLRSK